MYRPNLKNVIEKKNTGEQCVNWRVKWSKPRLSEQLKTAESPVKSCGDLSAHRGIDSGSEPSGARILAGSGGRKQAQSGSEPVTRGLTPLQRTVTPRTERPFLLKGILKVHIKDLRTKRLEDWPVCLQRRAYCWETNGATGEKVPGSSPSTGTHWPSNTYSYINDNELHNHDEMRRWWEKYY